MYIYHAAAAATITPVSSSCFLIISTLVNESDSEMMDELASGSEIMNPLVSGSEITNSLWVGNI